MTGSRAGLPGQLADLMDRQVGLLTELQGLLAQETDLLASGRHEPISALAEQKQRLSVSLMDLTGHLNSLLTGAGYRPDGDGLACYVQDAADDDLAQRLDATTKLLRTCATHNQANGGLVERRRSAVARALRVLLDCPEDNSRYHPTGRLEGVSPHRLIGEA